MFFIYNDVFVADGSYYKCTNCFIFIRMGAHNLSELFYLPLPFSLYLTMVISDRIVDDGSYYKCTNCEKLFIDSGAAMAHVCRVRRVYTKQKGMSSSSSKEASQDGQTATLTSGGVTGQDGWMENGECVLCRKWVSESDRDGHRSQCEQKRKFVCRVCGRGFGRNSEPDRTS